MVNGSWTLGHIRELWWGHGSRSATRVARVYPPCDTEDLQRLPLDRRLKQLYLVSVAQVGGGANGHREGGGGGRGGAFGLQAQAALPGTGGGHRERGKGRDRALRCVSFSHHAPPLSA